MKIHFAFCRHSQGNGQALCIKQLLPSSWWLQTLGAYSMEHQRAFQEEKRDPQLLAKETR